VKLCYFTQNYRASPSTLYGIKGFLIPLLTSELASQLSPILRGF